MPPRRLPCAFGTFARGVEMFPSGNVEIEDNETEGALEEYQTVSQK